MGLGVKRTCCSAYWLFIMRELFMELKIMEEKPLPNKSMIVTTANVVVLIIYTLLLRFTNNDNESIIAVAFIIVFHFILCLIIGLICIAIPRSKAYGKGFLLSSLAVLLIGFSTCYLAYTIK